MEVTPAPKPGDPCPQCGGAFVERPAATPEQRAAAADRDNPVPMSPHVDSAAPAQIAELGALYVCQRCDYRTRMKPEGKGKRGGKSQDTGE